ncbi:hypothetical protein ABZX92_08495 [Lentzea sp. NPDC006480]|uniref:hypothetical protein n=1 Tax=Lentzea sp. NPDC006480 TaxID=3157176 RepID=UPI0033B4E00F
MGAKLDFFADVVQTGTILGADADMGPDVVAAVLGDDFSENWNGRSYWRSYGLVEMAWYRRRRGLGLMGEHWAVQAHRLAYGVPLDRAIVARYGEFSGLQMFDELRDELARRGTGLVELGGPEFGHQQYWQPDAQVVLYVSVEDDPGTVQKIFSAFGDDHTITFKGDHRVVWQQMKEVCAMTEDQRRRWVEKKRPDDFRSWWRYCTRLTAARTALDEVGDRAAFVEFVFWMWTFGEQRDVCTSKEVAYQQAMFAARIDELHPELELPSHEVLAAACLSHVSELMTRDDKNLIYAAKLLDVSRR